MDPALLVLGFADSSAQANHLVNLLDIDYVEISLHKFPDGESKIQLPDSLPSHVILYRSLNIPNDKLIEILLVSRTARKFGCKTLTLVCPYLCYMRQDIAFTPGEAVSQTIIGEFLSTLFDNIITVDPHLHRTHRLIDAIPVKNAISLSAAQIIGEFLGLKFSSAILVGPDSESEPLLKSTALASGFDYYIAEKTRQGDFDVNVTIPGIPPNTELAVLVDDIASTGKTLICAAQALKQQGVKHIHCVVTHAMLSVDALTLMQNAGIEHIWSTDSISHWSNKIGLEKLLAQAIADLVV